MNASFRNSEVPTSVPTKMARRKKCHCAERYLIVFSRQNRPRFWAQS